jgi:NDP-sugar pyrophosphorylase family protein
MDTGVRLEEFVAIDQILNSDQFRVHSPFERLGTNLKTWLNSFLKEIGVKDKPVIKGRVAEGSFINGAVYIAEGAVVEPTAMIDGPCYIGPNSVVRHGAYIRGNVYVGADCIVGHTTEVKGAVFFDGAKAGHFAYVGDSILGRKVNLGAGTKLANFKFNGSEVNYRDPQTDKPVPSGLKKFGAIMADGSQTGCNAVLDPGSILLKDTAVLACVYFRGTLKRGIAR